MTKRENRRRVRLLLVDDVPAILDLLTEILAPEGYELETAGDGAIALDLIKKRAFDLIVSDFRMPRLSGKDLYNGAIAARPGIENRFIFITGEMDSVAKMEFIKQAGVRVINKPFRADEVRSVVKEALRKVGG